MTRASVCQSRGVVATLAKSGAFVNGQVSPRKALLLGKVKLSQTCGHLRLKTDAYLLTTLSSGKSYSSPHFNSASYCPKENIFLKKSLGQRLSSTDTGREGEHEPNYCTPWVIPKIYNLSQEIQTQVPSSQLGFLVCLKKFDVHQFSLITI